jgi:NTP pyrophosphatase (non-canonical NTP hydrolase)
MKEFDEYAEKIKEFMNPKVLENNQDILMNAVLGMCGESGEVADKVKKWLYHDQELDLVALDKEVGDVQFYIALYSVARNKPLSEIVQMNVDKLTKRYMGQPWSAEASKAKRDEIDYSEHDLEFNEE